MSFRDLPAFRDLRAFIRYLEERRLLARIGEPISLVHEMTEIHRRVLVAGGPALMFERRAGGAKMPVLANLFGTRRTGRGRFRRRAVGESSNSEKCWRPCANRSRSTACATPSAAGRCSTRRFRPGRAWFQGRTARPSVGSGDDVDLGHLPIQTCWPGEPAPLITWGLVITRPPDTEADDTAHMNIGVYRMQVLDKDRVIMRWLAHRGGAAHHRAWSARGKDTPVAVAIGADPATILSAVLPLPETVSELRFSGVLRGERPRIAPALTVPLIVPAEAEIVIEGFVSATETAPEGPYGDHTGYYNSVESFPVMRVTAITSRRDPIYLRPSPGGRRMSPR